MHIPDGFISAPVAVTAGVIAAGAISYGVRATGKKMGDKQVPMMGVLAAFIFAAQMLNFPVAGGTSGHFLGAVLAAVLLGPWAALLIMSSILIVQCLVFQDGGLLALGANILNMGVIAVFPGYYIYKGIYALGKGSRAGRLIGSGVAAWFSVVLAASACAVELSLSGTAPLVVALPAMAGIYALIGLGESLATVAVLSLITATRPDLLELQAA